MFILYGDCRKSVNNFFFLLVLNFWEESYWELFLFYIILFYSILLVLYFLEESYWDCASGVSFYL